MSRVRATISGDKRDIKEIWREDGIEIFLDPGNRYFVYYQLMINANGALTDMKVDIGENKKDDMEWNSNAEVKTKKFKDRWTAEIRIPLKTFENYKVWGINFCRNNSQEKGTHTLWSPTVNPSLGNKGFGVPEKFGRLVLDDKITAFKSIKNITGVLAFQPLGIKNTITISVDKNLVGKKLDVSIFKDGNQKGFLKNKTTVTGEKMEIPFLIYQSNEDPVYYLQIKCGDLELKIPFRFLTKDINFFAFPVDACLIYSSDESRANLRGSIEMTQDMLKDGSITMTLSLRELSTNAELIQKKIKLSSSKFDVILPLKDLSSGGYMMEISVEMSPDFILKNQYKFLKL